MYSIYMRQLPNIFGAFGNLDDFMAVVALAIELHFLANGIEPRAVLPDTEFMKGAE